MSYETVQQLIQSMQIKELLPPDKVMIVIEKNYSINNFLKTLSKNSILSAPVVDASPPNGQFLGIVDVLDLVSYVAEKAEAHSIQQIPDSPITKITSEGEESIPSLPDKNTYNNALNNNNNTNNVFNNDAFINQIMEDSVESVLRQSPFKPLFANTPLSLLIHIFAQGVHRVPIMNEHGEITNVISQSNIVQFLATEHCLQLVGHKGKKTVKEMGMGIKPVLAIDKRKRLIDAIHFMNDKETHSIRFSALPVVDDNGVLIGNISASDFAKVGMDIFHNLTITVGDFIQRKEIPKRAMSTITQQTTLDSLIRQLAKDHVHRVYVVDKDNKPISIISLTDVMKKVFSL